MTHDLAHKRRPTEDPHKHQREFLLKVRMVKSNEVTNAAIRLRHFPFSLQDLAKDWL